MQLCHHSPQRAADQVTSAALRWVWGEGKGLDDSWPSGDHLWLRMGRG